MEVTKNKELLDRKHFLMRALNNKNISQEEYDKEIPALEEAIKENLANKLEEAKEEIKTEFQQIKKTIIIDGDFKRAIASALIKFMEPDFTNQEIKGVARQMYKLMRLK